MASLNGWINGVYDVKSVRAAIDELSEACGVKCSFFGMNGENCISFFYNRNHSGPCFDRVIELFRLIAENPEAFGILHVQDDESKDYHDEFQVYVARKGVVEKVKDNYFSPCSEKIWLYDES